MLKELKNKLIDHTFKWSIERHRTSMSLMEARKYTRYWRRCQKELPIVRSGDPCVRKASQDFKTDGVSSFWNQRNGEIAGAIMCKLRESETSGLELWRDDGVPNLKNYSRSIFRDFVEIEELFKYELGDVLRNIFGCEFNIFKGVMHVSRQTQSTPAASQLWHNDGGPGVCINTLFYLNDATADNGAIEVLPWRYSKKLLTERRSVVRKHLKSIGKTSHDIDRIQLRDISVDYFLQQISQRYEEKKVRPIGPQGTTVMFMNNAIHRGGFPEVGQERFVCIFHCYPAGRPANFEQYRRAGISVNKPYPRQLYTELI